MVDALKAASTEERLARARRDEDRRVFAAEVREFGFIVLSVNGNHHNADPYLLYFPDGYGDIKQFLPGQLEAFGLELLSKLDHETDPKLLARREQIEAALNRFRTAEASYEAAREARDQAFALVQAGKRNWAGA